jgi:crotonobetainyl-CoA:carnitine CoA-transferase CaiB-like acyl-CoA transferase
MMVEIHGKVGVAVADITVSLYSHGTTLTALLQQVQTNWGQKIDCSLSSLQLLYVINGAPTMLLEYGIAGSVEVMSA